MSEFGVRNIVFSSSATVYGIPQHLPLSETHPAGACTNPYGKTKYFIEQIISDVCDSDEVVASLLLHRFIYWNGIQPVKTCFSYLSPKFLFRRLGSTRCNLGNCSSSNYCGIYASCYVFS